MAEWWLEVALKGLFLGLAAGSVRVQIWWGGGCVIFCGTKLDKGLSARYNAHP